MKIRHISRICSLLLIYVAVCSLVSCSQQASSPASMHPSPTTATPMPTAAPPSLLTPPPIASLPHDCSSLSPVRGIFPQLGPTVGQAPIWVTGFAEHQGASVLLIPGQDPYTSYGWIHKFVWTVGPDFTQPVTLRGQELYSKELLHFNVTDDNAITTTVVLDPRHPNHPVAAAGSHYTEWGSYLYIPQPGCYEIVATWLTGQTTIRFAVGHP